MSDKKQHISEEVKKNNILWERLLIFSTKTDRLIRTIFPAGLSPTDDLELPHAAKPQFTLRVRRFTLHNKWTNNS